jgi:prefoldin subunit 5
MDELKELKAQAYDLIAAIEHYQQQLQSVNQKIAELNQQLNNK